MKNRYDRFLAILAMVMMIAMIAAAFLCSCKQIEYVPVPEVHTDTVYQHQVQKDSVFLHDSIRIHERGDTVFFDRWHTKYIERIRIDTLYQSRVDSVAVPYPVEKIVKERYTPKAVKVLAWIGGTVLVGLVGWLAIFLLKNFRKTGLV